MTILKYLTIFVLMHTSSMYALSPSSDYLHFPFDVFSDLEVDSQTLQTADGFNIHSWSFHPKNNKKSILLFMIHSGEGNMSDYINRAGTIAQAGYDVILFDYRGFGYSDSYLLEEGQLYIDEFLTDFQAVYNHYAKAVPHRHHGIIGLGIGTIISQLFLLENSDPDFVVYEGFVSNPMSYALNKNSNKSRMNTLPKSAYSYEKNSKSIKTKTLIFASASDELSELYEINKYINDRKKSRHIEMYEGSHLQAMLQMTDSHFGDLYIARINEFITRAL